MLRFLRTGNKRTKMIWWSLIVITVVTFLGGFVFLLGSGLGNGFGARASGAVGTVGDLHVTRDEYTTALAEQRENYKRQYGTEPADRDLKMLEVQTWRSLVYQRLLAQEAQRAGIRATDAEIVMALKSSPPTMLQSAPAFQTDGKFDYAKYQQALSDPSNDWSGFEQMMREQLPTRKFQERMISSIKVPETEMQQAYHQRFDRVDGTVVQIGPDMAGEAPKIGEAELQKAFEKHKGRFTTAAHTELEVAIIPKKIGPAETKVAKDLADDLVRRARAGEDFAQLARDYSEGPGAEAGGVIERSFSPSDFEPTIAARITPLPIGGLTEAFQDVSRYVIIKRMPPDSTTAPGGMRIAQIVVKVKPDEEELRQQQEKIMAWRKQAKKDGLGKVAAANGLATFTTGAYDANNTPQQLYGVPEAADWGLTAKLREVSPVFESADDFVLVQVIKQEPAGEPKRADIEPALRQIAEIEARIARAKPKADAVAAALKSGKSLEEAAAAAGVEVFKVSGVTRVSPDPRLGNAPEAIGAMFGGKPGQVSGPIETVSGWYFVRADQVTPADMAAYVAMKQQILSEILEKRQRAFFSGYLTELRTKAKIQDLRNPTN